MILLRCLPLLLMAIMITAQRRHINITRNILTQADQSYASQHDILNMVVPLNGDNLWDEEVDEYWEAILLGRDAFFFVEADISERKYHGLYLYKNQIVTKILDHGRDATAFATDNKAYIGATDGIYVYDYKTNITEKFGSLNDSIIQIEANVETGDLYFVTDDHQLFKVADQGTKKNKVDIKNVKEIAFDFNNNLYYYNTQNDLYVLNKGGNKKIEGIQKGSQVNLIRPTFREMGVFAVVEDSLYLPNGDNIPTKIDVTFQVKPTAYAPASILNHYFALDKRIYVFGAQKVHLSHIADFDELLNAQAMNDVDVLYIALEIVS